MISVRRARVVVAVRLGFLAVVTGGCAVTASYWALSTSEIQAESLNKRVPAGMARVVLYRKDDVGWERGWLLIDEKRLDGHLPPYKFAHVDLSAGAHKFQMTLVSGTPGVAVNLVSTPEVNVDCASGHTYYIKQAWFRREDKPLMYLVIDDQEWTKDMRAMRPSGSKIGDEPKETRERVHGLFAAPSRAKGRAYGYE